MLARPCTEGSSHFRSASLPSWDILFPALAAGRNGAERGPSRSFIRTTVTRFEAHFGPFPVSLRPFSLTQPNHAHFGTVIGTSTDQWVRGSPKERSLEEPPSGEGNTARTVRYGTDLQVRPPSMNPGPSGRGKPCLSGGQGAVLAGDGVHPGAQDLKACWEARSEDMRRKISRYRCANDTHDLAQRLSYSSWRRHHAWGNSSPSSFLPHGARSRNW